MDGNSEAENTSLFDEEESQFCPGFRKISVLIVKVRKRHLLAPVGLSHAMLMLAPPTSLPRGIVPSPLSTRQKVIRVAG